MIREQKSLKLELPESLQYSYNCKSSDLTQVRLPGHLVEEKLAVHTLSLNQYYNYCRAQT